MAEDYLRDWDAEFGRDLFLNRSYGDDLGVGYEALQPSLYATDIPEEYPYTPASPQFALTANTPPVVESNPAPAPTSGGLATLNSSDPYNIYDDDSAPAYSPETLAYFEQLNNYISGRSPTYGSYGWGMPQQSLTFGGTRKGIAEETLPDADRVRTRYTSNTEYAPYLTKPVEQNARYQFNLPSSGGDLTGNVSVDYNTPIALVNNRTKELVYSGLGFEAAEKIANMARELTKTDEGKAEWAIYTAPPGATSPDQFRQVAEETSGKGILGVLGTILPIAVSFIPGFGQLSTLAKIGAMAGAGGAGAALRGDNILTGALIGGATQGVLSGTGLDKAIGGVLNDIPGVGDALRAVSKGLAPAASNTAANAAANAAANEIVVTGARGIAPSLISGGLSSLASSVVPELLTNPVTGEMSLSRPAQPTPQEPVGGLDALATDEIVVNAGRNIAPDVASGLAGLANTFVPEVTTNPVTGEMSVQQAEPRVEEPPPPQGSPDEIVVTGGSDVMPDLVGGLSSLVNTAAPIVNQSPYTAPAEVAQTTEQQTQTEPEQTGPLGEIVVTGTGTAPGAVSGLGGALTNLATTTGPEPRRPDYGDKVEDEPQDQTSSDEIVVTGTGTDPNAISGLGGLTSLTNTTPTTGPEPRRPDYGDRVEDEPQDQTTDEIVVTGTSTDPNAISGLGAAAAAAAAAAGGSTPSGTQTTQDQTQQQTDDEIVVTGTSTDPNAVSGLASAITNAAATADAAANTETKTLDTMDKIRLGLIAAGLVSDVAGGGSGSQTKLPFGFGARNPIYSAKLPTPGQNGAFAVGGLGGSTLPVPPGGDYTQFGMGSATRATPTQIPQYGGVNPPGFNTQTWDWLGPQTGVAKDIMDQLAVLPSSAAPAEEPVKKAMGGYAVGGPGDGRSDEIPALLSDGEYVIDAETVALLGNGSNKAGAKQLDKFRANIRKHKGQQLAKGKFSVKAKQPSAYLSGGR